MDVKLAHGPWSRGDGDGGLVHGGRLMRPEQTVDLLV